MQAILHAGELSNRSLPLSQKSSSEDNPQNGSASSEKGRKRERMDDNSDPSKRQRSLDSVGHETNLVNGEANTNINEISNLLEGDGALSNAADVDHLVNLMHHDQDAGIQTPVDIVLWRTALVGVIAATERADCLKRFVQIGGLLLSDKWLQEVNNSKSGDSGSPKEADRESEDFLLALLSALEKIPVDLAALKTCSIGKSVNNLRSHKNFEIQKRARKLIDFWKKQVDAEIKQLHHAKPVSKENPPSPGKQDLLHPSFLNVECNLEASIASSGVLEGILKVASDTSGSTKSISKNDTAHLETEKINSSASATRPVGSEENQSKVSSDDPFHETCSNSNQATFQPAWQNGQAKDIGLRSKDDRGMDLLLLHDKAAASKTRSHATNNKGGVDRVRMNEIETYHLLREGKTEPLKKKGKTVSGSEKGCFEGNSLQSSSNNHKLLITITNSMQEGIAKPVVDVLTTPSMRFSPNMSDKHGQSSVDDAGDTKNSPQKQASSLEGVTYAEANFHKEAEQQFSHSENKDNVNGNKIQEWMIDCNCLNFDDSSLDPETACSTMDSTGTNHQVHAEGPKQSELLATALSPNYRAFESSHDPCLELAITGIDLLASVAASESSSSDETVSPVILSRSSTFTGKAVGEEGGSVNKAEVVDSLYPPDRSEIVGEETEREQFQGPQSALSSFTEMERKQKHGAGEKGAILGGRSSGIQIEDLAGLEGSIAVPASKDVSMNSSFGGDSHVDQSDKRESLFSDFQTSTHIIGAYCTGDDDATDEKDTKTADAGQVQASKKDIELRVSNVSMKYNEKDAIELAMQVAEELEQELEDHDKTAAEDKTFGLNSIDDHKGPITKETADSTSVIEFPSKSSNGLAPYRKFDLSRNQSLSATAMLSQDGKNAERIMGTSEETAIEIVDDVTYDEDQSYSPSQQHETVCGVLSHSALSSQQVLRPPACNAESNTTNLNLKNEKGATGDDVRQRSGGLDFDLNERVVEEAAMQDALFSFAFTVTKAGRDISTSGLTTPIAVVTATKGPFILPATIMQENKREPGWKGSAATSAFRPAEPRRVCERQSSFSQNLVPNANSGTNKPSRPRLDFDLNIADETGVEDAGSVVQFSSEIDVHNRRLPTEYSLPLMVLEEVNGSKPSVDTKKPKRPILDLNQVHEYEDAEAIPGSKCEVRAHNVILVDSNKFLLQKCKSSMLAFDLNDGPLEEEGDESVMSSRIVTLSANVAPEVSEPKSNEAEQARSAYSAVAVPLNFASATGEAVSFVARLGQSASRFHGEVYRSGAAFSSSMTGYSNAQQNLSGGYPFACNAASFRSVSAQFMESSRLCSARAPSSRLVSAVTSHAMPPPYGVGAREVRRRSGVTAWTRRDVDLNGGPDDVLCEICDEGSSSREGRERERARSHAL